MLTIVIVPNTIMEAHWTGKVYLLPSVPCRLLLGTPLITHFNAVVQHAVGRFFYYLQYASKPDLVALIPVDTTGGGLSRALWPATASQPAAQRSCRQRRQSCCWPAVIWTPRKAARPWSA